MMKMRKLFFKLSMLLFVLAMSVNAAWANMEDVSSLPPQVQQTLAQKLYCARLTGHTSSTGGGKVYVNVPEPGQSVADSDPRNTPYVEDESNVAVNGMGMSMAGMTKIGINAWAKADPGYWFAGFSFANGGTDLGTATDENMPGLYASSYDIGVQENETIDHVIYGTFEPIRVANYEVAGNTTTENGQSDQTVIFTLAGAQVDMDEADFQAPVITGDGWSLNGDWSYADGQITVPVRFSTESAAVAEYTGNLRLRTVADVEVNVPLYARTTAPTNIEAILYNKSGDELMRGKLLAMIAAAEPTDVIKLNKDYNKQIEATKSFTLDLNGYNLTYNFNDVVADYGTPEGQIAEARIAKAAILVNDADAVVTLAYSPYGGKIVAGPYNDAVDIKAGKLVLKGGTLTGFFGVGSMGGNVVQSGATIIGSAATGCAVACMGGSYTMTDGKIYGMFGSIGGVGSATAEINGGTIDNRQQTIEGISLTGGTAVQIGTGSTATINKGTIVGKTYGVKNAGGTITIEKQAVISGGSYALDFNSGLTTINCGKFGDPTTMCDLSTIESKIASGNTVLVSCYLKTNNPGASNYWGIPVWRNTSGVEFGEGYTFFVGPESSAQAAGVSVCHIGGTSYSTLEKALNYANGTNEDIVIVMDNDYTLPAGYYTLPSNATLLVPMSNEQGAPTPIVSRSREYSTPPTMFRKLTFAKGVNMNVYGTIEVSGMQYAGANHETYGTHTGATNGNYAQLQMNEGSKMTLMNNAILRAWGYVTGDIEHKNTTTHVVPMGEIDVRRGANVYELFQMGDWGETLSNGVGLVMGETRFPLTSYYIQNVEVPTKYHPGGKLTSVTTVANTTAVNVTMSADDIQIIGVTGVGPAMFLMDQEADAENTWVRKWYDASKDQQVYEISSGAHIGNLVIRLASSPLLEGLEKNIAAGMLGSNLSGIGNTLVNMGVQFERDLIMNSGQYVLPITSNFKLHLLNGTLDFTQSTELLPGSELVIDKEATVYVTDQGKEDVLEGSLYVYDYRDWSDQAAEGQPAQKVLYTPSFDDGVNNGAVPDAVRDVSTCEALGHAKVNVRGTFDTSQGYIFTSENGGNIFSSVEDAGTFTFTSAAKADDYTEDVKVTTGSQKVFKPAFLRNSDEYVAANGGNEGTYRYIKTGGTAAGKSYCFMDIDGSGGHWMSLEQRGCFTVDAKTPGEHTVNDVYYIKPQEYVAVVVTSATKNGNVWTIEGNADHTYSDAAGAGRLFILMTDEDGLDCQWWEVEAKKGYFHCIHPENDTYYEWDNTNKKWKEKTFKITWKDWDGTILTSKDKNNQDITYYEVTYGTQAEYRSEDPTRAATEDYTYTFTGWSPALGKVTSDVTYTATYQENPITYTVKFLDEGKNLLYEDMFVRNSWPVCPNEPTKTGYTLVWTPQLEAVKDNATYRATWELIPPTEYEIKFVDDDADKTVLQNGMVAVGAVPEYAGATPTGKPESDEYTYVFDHWSPALEEVSASSAKIYTAVYRKVQKTFTISYYKENGTTLNTTEQLPYGATPTPPAVTKENPVAGHSYTLVWKTLDGNSTIQTVTGAASYKPTYLDEINKYNVTVKSNPSGACTISGNGVYNHGSSATITLTKNDGYNFAGWSDGYDDDNNLETVPPTSRTISSVTSDVNLVANFTYAEEDKVTITWKNGETTLAAVDQKPNTATIFPLATLPTVAGDAQYTCTFDGWVTETNYPTSGAFYKNNMTPKATEDETYYAHFTRELKTYTITWKNENGTDIEIDFEQPYGAAIEFNSATPVKNADAAATYAFDGWSTSQGGDVVVPTTVTGNATYYAHFAATSKTYTITWKRDDGTLIDNTEVAHGVMPSHADPAKAATAEYDYAFNTWSPDLETVTGVATYTASFNSTKKSYTITWKSEDGTTLQTDENVEYGTATSYNGTPQTKSNTSDYTYVFDGWATSLNGVKVYNNGETPAVRGNATYYAHFDRSGFDVNADKTLSEDVEATTTTVHVAGTLNIASGKTLETENLVIEANPSNSGQIINAGTIDAFNIYFDLTRGAGNVFKHHTWYAFSVPFIVDASKIQFDGVTMQYGQTEKQDDYDVLYYDGSVRAELGKDASCWKYVEKATPTYLYPGTLYMIANTRRDVTTLRFPKAAGALLTTSVSVAAHAQTTGVESDANWNGIANPALYHAKLSGVGATENVAWIYNPDYADPTNAYVKIDDLSARNIILGEAIFVQTATGTTIDVTPTTASPVRRRTQTFDSEARYQVKIAKADGNATDDVIIRTDEDKEEDAYVLGRDLVRMGMSSINPQLWINRYDEKLCVNVAKPINEEANYPLGIFAPADGEYRLFTETEPNEQTALYLTLEGEAIWNLSDAPYTFTLNKGTSANYGLRISAKKAPQTATGVDEAIVDAQGETRKVLIDNKVFIIRGNNVYSVDGQLVK
jgi:hypothetical protein